jgi:hypothetical protein
MRKQLTILSGVLAAWAISSAPAFAFQETQVAPEPSLSMNGSNGESNTFDLLATDPMAGEEKSDKKLQIQEDGTLQVLPKLNFGLDVMYGSPDDDSTIAHVAPVQDFETSDGVRILGTLKRRF